MRRHKRKANHNGERQLPSFVTVGSSVRHRQLGSGMVARIKARHVVVSLAGRDVSFAHEDVVDGILEPSTSTSVALDASGVPDLSRLPTAQIDRAHQLLTALVHNRLRPETGEELKRLLGRPVLRIDAQGLANELSRNRSTRSLRVGTQATTRKPNEREAGAIASQPRHSSTRFAAPLSASPSIAPSTSSPLALPLVEISKLVASSGVRHGFDHRLAEELISRSFSRKAAMSFNEVGPLKLAGYQVGANSPSIRVRREILEDFVCSFPIVSALFDPAYLRAWGKPASTKRKRHTEEALGRMIALNGSRPNMESAVADWKSDLAWLRGSKFKSGLLVPR